MLIKPDFPDEKIIACLQAEYGLQIELIAFLPVGGDMGSALYRAVADDDTPFFVKLRRGKFDGTSVELPNLLSDRGIRQIISPLTTNSGQLYAGLDELRLILYPFVEGKNGSEVELTERQWEDFGAAFKQIHTTQVPAALRQKIRREEFAPEWRDLCRNIIGGLDGTFQDPIAVNAAAFLRSKRELLLDYIGRAERLALLLVPGPSEMVLCHSDIHPGNLLLDTNGLLYIVDWDRPILAPKERDLMFIGGGQGYIGLTALKEETLFYHGYGPSQIDPVALAYYRYERNIMDISVESERIFSTTLGEQDRAQSLEYLQLYFLPDCTIEIANSSDRTRSDR